jgi:hypothetical protein
LVKERRKAVINRVYVTEEPLPRCLCGWPLAVVVQLKLNSRTVSLVSQIIGFHQVCQTSARDETIQDLPQLDPIWAAAFDVDCSEYLPAVDAIVFVLFLQAEQ